jgi:hypothetical protein
MKDEALKLALEALENWREFDPENFGEVDNKAITAIKQALANAALDRKAENARELGLDYEPAPVQEPVAFFHPNQGFYWARPTKITAPATVDVEPLPLYTTPPEQPAQQEPLTFAGLAITEIRLPKSMTSRFECGVLIIEAAHGIKE